jgi:C4-dicarboxylate-specific signal transduction histidine kinase
MLELEGRFDLNFRVVHKLGDIRWVNLRGSSTLDEKEQVTYFDGIMLDVTEQKRVNDLLTSQQSKMASSARLSALGEMAGGIAHEINNPLAIINLRTHQLTQLTAKDKLNPNDVVNIAEAIEATTMRISKIIKALQIVARESESDPFETTPVIEIVSDAVELCNQRMKKHGIQLIVDPIPPKLMIECRCVQVSQVLINLLNNAFDAIVELPSKWVRISAREVDNSGRQSVEISVADSGNAIRVDLALKIFQPFFTTKGPGKGTGLGLSISKGMIESQDGNIFLDTDHATTRFVIVLPKEQQAGDQAKHQKQLQGPQTPPQEHFL